MAKTQLDLGAVFDALDAKRHAWGTTWRAICLSADVHQSTITRWKAGDNISATNLAALMAWFGETDLAPYLVDAPNVVEPHTTTR